MNHPVFFYGIFFVGGFILGYFIINPIFRRFLIESRELSIIDIVNWPKLIEQLQTSSSPLTSQLKRKIDPSTLQQLKHQTHEKISDDLQKGIIDGFNQLLKDPSISRDDLQKEFDKSIAPVKQTAYFLTDRLCWFTVAGTIIGARLGAVFFYDWPLFRDHPAEIFKIWHGGLASHGGFLGVILSIYAYLKYIHQWIPKLTFLRLVDFVTIPATLICCFIRLGNFMNQEILGTPSTVPWAIIFGNPADGSDLIPRHPVQLYEAVLYLLTFCILWNLWKNKIVEHRPGAILGLSFILGFGGRFFLEFWKSNQDSSFLNSSFLQMGQILSIPFIIFGIYLVFKKPVSCSKPMKKIS